MPGPVLTDTTVLIALGGNALAPGETTGDIHEQFALTAAVLVEDIGAQEMYILTDVPEVYLYFRTDSQQPIRRMSMRQAQVYLDEGHFPPGSMGSKMEAAIQFITKGGVKVVMTNIDTIEQALAGEGGTTIYP